MLNIGLGRKAKICGLDLGLVVVRPWPWPLAKVLGLEV